jgi:hypothetical protein
LRDLNHTSLLPGIAQIPPPDMETTGGDAEEQRTIQNRPMPRNGGHRDNIGPALLALSLLMVDRFIKTHVTRFPGIL